MSFAERVYVHPIEVRGREFPVQVDAQGRWWTPLAKDQWASADSRQKLYDKLMEATRKAATKLDIPVSVLSGTRFHRGGETFSAGTLTGRHGGNGNVILVVDGKAEQLTGYQEQIFRRLDADEATEGLRLLRAEHKARDEWEHWQSLHKVDAGKLVDAAFAKAGEPS